MSGAVVVAGDDFQMDRHTDCHPAYVRATSSATLSPRFDLSNSLNLSPTLKIPGRGGICAAHRNASFMSVLQAIGTQEFLPALLTHIRNSAKSLAVPLDLVILQSVLLCLIAGEKNLILRTPDEDVALTVRLAVWVSANCPKLPFYLYSKGCSASCKSGILGVACMDTGAFIRPATFQLCLSPSLFTSRLYLFSVHQHMFDFLSVGGMLTGLCFLLRLWIPFHLSLSRPRGAMVISKHTFWLDWISAATSALLPNSDL